MMCEERVRELGFASPEKTGRSHELQGRKSCLDVRKNSLLVEGRQQRAERLGISVMEIFQNALTAFSLPATNITSLFEGL